VTDEEKLERVARELCQAAGENPDAKIRMGQPLSFTVGNCTVVKPLILPAWKAYSREARRLSMSDAEHGDARKEESQACGEPLPALRQVDRSGHVLGILLRRRLHRLRSASRLMGLCLAIQTGAVARAGDIRAFT
jgi:hypothetical protein